MDIHKNARLTAEGSRADRAPGDERADAEGRRISRRRLPADCPQMGYPVSAPKVWQDLHDRSSRPHRLRQPTPDGGH